MDTRLARLRWAIGKYLKEGVGTFRLDLGRHRVALAELDGVWKTLVCTKRYGLVGSTLKRSASHYEILIESLEYILGAAELELVYDKNADNVILRERHVDTQRKED